MYITAKNPDHAKVNGLFCMRPFSGNNAGTHQIIIAVVGDKSSGGDNIQIHTGINIMIPKYPIKVRFLARRVEDSISENSFTLIALRHFQEGDQPQLYRL